MDQNDNPPVFQQSSYSFNLPEGSYSTLHHVGDVRATDADTGNDASLDYEIIAGNSGMCVTPTEFILGKN